jgi:hypothetical protein
MDERDETAEAHESDIAVRQATDKIMALFERSAGLELTAKEELYRAVLASVRSAAASTGACVQAGPPSPLKLRGDTNGLRYECSHPTKHCYEYGSGLTITC